MDQLSDPSGESAFISQMFDKDAKNYHVWSYRQWLVTRFSLPATDELPFIEALLQQDIRNNSAWNHRFFVVFGGPASVAAIPADIARRELDYAHSAIRTAPQNQSPWNYLRG